MGQVAAARGFAPARGWAAARLARAAARLAGAAVALAAAAALAHAAFETRTLRLQLGAAGLQGLLIYRVPAKQARVLAAPLPGAPARPRGPQAVALRLAPEALRGLSIALDPPAPAHAPEPLGLVVAEASAREAAGGALETALLLQLREAPLQPGSRLHFAVEEGAPLPIELVAATGLRLELLEGPGAPVPGGLALRPRRGAPCVVLLGR